MAISAFSAGPARKRVGFVGKFLDEGVGDIFRQRGYDCILLTTAMIGEAGLLETIDAVVISQRPEKPSHISRDLELFSGALNYDCRIYIRYAPDPSSQTLVLNTLSRMQLPPSGFEKAQFERFSKEWFDPTLPIFPPFVHILRADANWHPLANLIAANPAGPPPNPHLKINIRGRGTDTSDLNDEQTLLVKRAFFDCSSIDLFSKTDGKSGVDAFDAFAHLATNRVGSRTPYRCFVKLGPRIKVAREFEKYQTTALENVPFHLGPRLRASRCVLGKSLGLITCDYVAGAETLRDCVRNGRGLHVISNLFNQTLISWRRAATPAERSLHEFLIEHLDTRDSIPRHREPLIRTLGATKTLEQLKALISQGARSHPVLSGVVHGDLHATNVLVRMNDAVIIDLERIAVDQPLLLDAASLEGGLLVDGFVGDSRSVKDVLATIRPLYTAASLQRDRHHCDPADKSAWFVDCVRQIRMQAWQMEQASCQYGWTLAAVLLRKACNPEKLLNNGAETSMDNTLTPEVIRAMAFVVAEEIILNLLKLAELDVDE